MYKFILELLTSSFLGKIFDFFTQLYQQRKAVKQREKYKRLFADIKSINQVMKEVIAKTRTDRFVILRASNSGKKPSVASGYYLSVIQEQNTKQVNPVERKYQKVQVDEHYVHLLDSLLEDGQTMIRTADLPPSLLKGIYLADQLHSSRVYLIKQDKQQIIYASVSAKETMTDLPSNELHEIELAIKKIRTIYRHVDLY